MDVRTIIKKNTEDLGLDCLVQGTKKEDHEFNNIRNCCMLKIFNKNNN